MPAILFQNGKKVLKITSMSLQIMITIKALEKIKTFERVMLIQIPN